MAISSQVMGIINLTSDSFFAGSRAASVEQALQKAHEMVAEGADILDIGGESSRPGSQPISAQEELDRIIPVIEKIQQELPVIISVDTYKPEVMQAAIQVGAHMINDIYALQKPGALEIIRDNPKIKVCLMHMQNTPQNMQQKPFYQNVVSEVKNFLQTRMDAAIKAGIAQTQLMIDPGFGFGKTARHNLQLLKHLAELQTLQAPIVVGWSRKATIGEILKKPIEQRLYGSIAAQVIALMQGASVIRSHDVAASKDALMFTAAVLNNI